MHPYWTEFELLIKAPFAQAALIWGIVPLYFGWLLNELTSTKASYRTAVQTGFCFLWAAAQWLYPYCVQGGFHDLEGELKAMLPVNLAVTALVLVLGIAALVSGLRRRFPKYGRFLGHTRFANYFMITIYPMQAPHCLAWNWLELETIVIFALPVWLVLDVGLLPVRK